MEKQAIPGIKSTGMARIGLILSNLSAGKLQSPLYSRQPIPEWDVGPHEYVLLKNMNLVDVDVGVLRKERAVLIQNKRIEALILPEELDPVTEKYPVKKTINGNGQYLIPGLSDIHGHTAMISEFDLSLSALRYFDAQRQKNCEEALKSGCTFVRDSGGAYDRVRYLQDEINENRLLGPKIMPSYEVMTPRGGMWDINPVMNRLHHMLAGGRVLNFARTDQEILHTLDRFHRMGCESFKTYFEDKPLYGKTEQTVYNMFTPQQADLMRKTADKYGKLLEAHSMFIKGSRRVIDAGFDSIGHLTVDEPYALADAEHMAKNGTAIVPTLGVGCYCAVNCGKQGYPEHPELRFFQQMLHRYVPEQIKRVTIPQLRENYAHFYEWITREISDRKMPGVGMVYPERMHGFAVYAGESLRRFQDAGTKVGVGTDGGTGITFVGQLAIEFEGYHRYGYSPAQILRMATLGNMEIVKKADDLGSIEPGKYADLVLLARNPLEDIQAIQDILMVMKDGRVYYQRPLNR